MSDLSGRFVPLCGDNRRPKLAEKAERVVSFTSRKTQNERARMRKNQWPLRVVKRLRSGAKNCKTWIRAKIAPREAPSRDPTLSPPRPLLLPIDSPYRLLIAGETKIMIYADLLEVRP